MIAVAAPDTMARIQGAPGLLDLPSELLGALAALLEEPSDRASLAATSKTLLKCSRQQQCAQWWGRLHLTWCRQQQTDTRAAIASLSAWLSARRPPLLCLQLKLECDRWYPYLSETSPAPLLPTPPRRLSGQQRPN